MPSTTTHLRFGVQKAIKGALRGIGLEVRYAFQNRKIYDPAIYARFVDPALARVIFDVGANIGQSAAGFLGGFPNATVYALEPFPAPFAKLIELKTKHAERLKPLPFAVGDKDQTVSVRVAAGSTNELNSLVHENEGVGANGQSVDLNVRSLDSICREHGIRQIDVLKTDTEGYDDHVLAGASELLSRGAVKVIISEVGFLDDEIHTPFNRVFSRLAGQGYELAGFYELSYLPGGECDFANAMFVTRR